MGGGQTELAGPDLAEGIVEAALAGDRPLLGHAAGEAVMLVRRGEEVLAVGATCTHYSGPLAEGLVVGDTVRCPWHHACFDLRTGAPERGPALNPIPCYAVSREGGRIRVGARREIAPPAAPASAARTIAIVGAGAAGEAAAETLRHEGYSGAILMLSADDAPPVDRPNLSKDYLAGTAPEEWIPLRPPSFFEEQRIELALGARVTRLDAGARTFTLADGRTRAWDALLLATGAEPIRLTVPGADLPHVRTLRTLADSRAIIKMGTLTGSPNPPRVVVVGASFIGMEAAASLRARGLEVHVVAPEAQPFARTLGAELGAFLRGVHQEHGVVFHLGQTVTAVDARAVTLSGGETLPADLVVVGIGVRPAIGLAEAAGLTVDRGVMVDEHLRTSTAGVYAAGDIARYPYGPTGERVRIEHWAVALRMGRVAALNMLGKPTPFASAPFFWTTQYDVTINYVGHAESWDRIDVAGNIGARDCTLAYRRAAGAGEEQTLAVATVGRDHVSLEAEVALERGDTAALRAFGRSR
jgi:NADPH-dependent 2,4-dienoyl-CoA reductase/sulfur reductase-like enzyme/nitrite reductase/ring-hydroxylating ferredoxin subunit